MYVGLYLPAHDLPLWILGIVCGGRGLRASGESNNRPDKKPNTLNASDHNSSNKLGKA